MRTYIRDRTSGGTYFFTVNLAERRGNTLLTDRIDHLRAAFRETLATHPVTMDAIVILPDHLHCLWRLPLDDDGYGMRWPGCGSRFEWLTT